MQKKLKNVGTECLRKEREIEIGRNRTHCKTQESRKTGKKLASPEPLQRGDGEGGGELEDFERKERPRETERGRKA